MQLKNLNMKKIILFGGSFDPVHFGHLILAQYAQEFLNAEKVIFIPCYKPPHKIGYKLSSWQHRLNMLLLATKNNDKFEVSKFEIERKDISYTYITVDYFKNKYKDYELYFLIGYDSLITLTTWQRWEDILKNVYFVVGKRIVKKDKKLPKQIYKKVIFFDTPIIEISSTEIRQRVKKSLPIKYFVPESVEKYIIENKLYR